MYQRYLRGASLILKSIFPPAPRATLPFIASRSISRPLTRSFSIQKPIPSIPPPPPKTPLDLQILRDLKGPTRWIVLGSLAVLATAETTFYAKIVHAKFLAKEDDVAANEFLGRMWEAERAFRKAWLPNYWGYYGNSVWGL